MTLAQFRLALSGIPDSAEIRLCLTTGDKVYTAEVEKVTATVRLGVSIETRQLFEKIGRDKKPDPQPELFGA